MRWELPGEIRVEWAQKAGRGDKGRGHQSMAGAGWAGGLQGKAHPGEGSLTGRLTCGNAHLWESSPRWTPISGAGLPQCHTSRHSGGAGLQDKYPSSASAPVSVLTAPLPHLGCPPTSSSRAACLSRALCLTGHWLPPSPPGLPRLLGSTSLTADSRVREGRGCNTQLDMCRSPGE